MKFSRAKFANTAITAFPKSPETGEKTPGEKCGCSAQKEARGCLAEIESIKECSKLLLSGWYLPFLAAGCEG